MANKNPNGNIIVDEKGNYNRFDMKVHEKIFDKVKSEYVIGDPNHSKMLVASEIASKSPAFLTTLSSIIGITGHRAIDIISRKGRELSANQVNSFLSWLRI